MQYQRVKFWAASGFSALIVILIAVFVDVTAVAGQLQQTDWRYALAAAAALVGGLAAYAFRWRLLLANKPGWLPTFHASNVGHLVNTFIPLRAGEPARIVTLAQQKSIPLAEVTSSVVVERLFEQIMRLSAFGSAFALGAGLQASGGTLLAGIGFVIVAFAGLFWLVNRRAAVLARWPPLLARLPRLSAERARQSLSDLLEGLSSVASPRRLALALLWSSFAWVCFWAFHFLALLALGPNLPPGERLALSLGALALAPPSAPTQPGVYQASVVVPLALIGFDETTLTSYAIILHALQILWMTGLGAWGLIRSGASTRDLVRGSVGQSGSR